MYEQATTVIGQFVDAAAQKIGDFEGFVCCDEQCVQAHGKGSYEPPSDGGLIYFEVVEPHPLRSRIERAYIRRGVIGFRAWLSPK